MLDWITRKKKRRQGSPASVPIKAESSPQAFYEEQRRGYEAYLATYMDDRFMRSPRVLSIETYVKCNATCEFCPYPTSDRIGQKLDTGIIHKIIDDIASSDVHPEFFIPSRINEPMFDHRMYAIFEYVATKLPRTPIGHFTNGTTLSKGHIERLCSTPNLGFINVSLNSHDPAEHQRLMGLSFELVIKNLKALHHVYEARNFKFPVNLTRVGDGTTRDTDFLRWCRSVFPLFHPTCRPRFDWLGKTHSMDVGRAPPGCTQWFALNFLANGREALCCIDDDGRFGTGDAHHQNALDVYNHPIRLALREKKLRSLHPACAACDASI
ncbi:radical SAM/SPASM domain-containing protein [Methylocapsa acidiphila]|uniref:radical SAM/SPASM domain-containing protein n=1 Tax=Methylocapsa acidiphila TaxID=133552 RepID=UPI0012EC59D1|nr:radical SAM/SPASM domain-containing protein [Methylocapsa acidiphila]